MVRGYYKGAAFYTDIDDLIHSRVHPVVGEEYYDIPTTLIYYWDGLVFRNSAFTTRYTYSGNGSIDTNKIYLARPGQRILGVLNGVDESTCSLTRRLNDTDELSFTVNRIIDGEVSSFYDKIERHYELYIPAEGWFKIVDEPELTNDGNVETKSVIAESYEIELQQYDLVNFYINTGEVYSKEILATDNTYDVSGYSIPRDNILFYRDTTELEKAIKEFSETDGSVEALAKFAETHPIVFSSWRITKGDNGVEIDSTNESGGDYTGTEILDLELARQHELSFLWLVLHEHNWNIGYVDPYVDLSSELDDDRIPLAKKVGKFEIESQDIYSFLTQEAANYFRCVFVFDTKRRLVNAYNINNIGYDTNIFLSWHNIQNSVTRSGEEDLYTVFRVSGDDDLDFTEANFGLDIIEDITYFLTTDHFSQEFIDKYKAWMKTRENYRQQYIQLSKDYRKKDAEAQEIYTRVPADSSDTAQYSSFTEEELIAERSIQEALLRGYQAMYVDENGDFDEAALLASKDATDYLLLRDVILSQPLDALDNIEWKYDWYYHTGEYIFRDTSNRLGNIDIAIFNKRFISGYYEKDDDPTEVKQAKVKASNAKDFIESYMYDFDTYGSLYGVAELQSRQATLKNQYQTLASKGFDVDDTTSPYHHSQYLLYVKYLNAYKSCTAALEERMAEYDKASNELASIRGEMQEVKDKVAKEKYFTDEELELLDHYYIYTDYTNDNILITSTYSGDEIVDTEDQLYRDAADRLYVESHPQYTWSTSQDNLLLMPEFQYWHGQLNPGNYIRISMRDDWQVKLRVSEVTLNPMMIDPTIDLVFTTMTSYKSRRNDAVSILGGSGGSSKNSISSNFASRAATADTVNVSTDLIMKILKNGAFSNYMGNYQDSITGQAVQAVSGNIDNLVAESLQSATISVDKLTGTQAQFQEVFSQYIGANYLATRVLEADEAKIKDLSAEVIRVGENSITTIAEGTITTEKVVSALVTGDEGDFDTLKSNTAFIEYLNSGIIEAGTVSADKVIAALVEAKSGDFDELTADSAFIQYLNSGVIEAGTVSADTVIAALVDAKTGDFDNLKVDSAFMEYLNANLVVASEIKVDDLKAKLASIQTLEADSAFVKYLQSLSSTTATTIVNDAYIREAVIGKISVGDLSAGNIVLSDKMQITSENGSMVMNGRALQISGKDAEGNDYVGIQLGYDTSSNPSLILRNEKGVTILTPGGITGDAISAGLLVNDMLADSTIQKSKLGFDVVEANEFGGVDITNIYDGNEKWGASYTSFKQSTEKALDEIAEKKMYRAVIESDNGNIFKNGDINCTLVCRVYSWDDEITDSLNATCFVWRRRSKDTASDIIWNTNHSSGVKTLTLTPSDVYGRSVFYCDVTLPDGSTVTSG